MGQSGSKEFKETFEKAVSELSEVQIAEIGSRFNALYKQSKGQRGKLIDREAFSQYFNLPVAVGDRLFNAFDKKQNGEVDFEEFLCGLAIVLHGSFSDKCRLLFELFNITGDEGISREELHTMLSSIFTSTSKIMLTLTAETDLGDESLQDDQVASVNSLVQAAFQNCDISHSGKLLPLEFEYWVRRHPEVLDLLLPANLREKDESMLSSLLVLTDDDIEKPTSLLPTACSPDLSLRLVEVTVDSFDGTSSPCQPATEPQGDITPLPLDPSPLGQVSINLDSPASEGSEQNLPGVEEPPPSPTRELPSEHYLSGVEEPPPSPVKQLHYEQNVSGVEKVLPSLVRVIPLEQNLPGVEEPPPSPVTNIPIEQSLLGVEELPSSPVRGVPSEQNLSGVEEPPPSPVGELPSFEKDADASTEECVVVPDEEETRSLNEQAAEATDTEIEDTNFQPTTKNSDLRDEEVDDVTMSEEGVSVPANEDTIRLARQISRGHQDSMSSSLGSPTEEKLPSLFQPSVEKEEEVAVDDCILSAWLPGMWVRGVLSSGRKVAPEHLARPGLITLTGKHDPLGELLSSTFPDSNRCPQLSADQVKTDEDGVRKLIHNGSYHSALALTSLFLSAHGQGHGLAGQMTIHTHKTLQMWSVRLSLLCILGRYKDAEEEMLAFGELDFPDLCYQYNRHNYPGKVGSMVPFCMRVLHAELPMYRGNLHQALNRLCMLQSTTQQVLALVKAGKIPLSEEALNAKEIEVAGRVWRRRLARVKCGLAACLLALSDVVLARQVLHSLFELLPEQVATVKSAIGRLCLQCGDLNAALKQFSGVEAIANSDPSKVVLVHCNRGFVNIFQSQWKKAEQNFKDALKIDPNNLAAANNAAVCALYQAHLPDAIAQQEDTIKQAPPHSFQAALFSNLFTCYDLESSRSQARKLAWLPLLGSHVPEGFNVAALGIAI